MMPDQDGTAAAATIALIDIHSSSPGSHSAGVARALARAGWRVDMLTRRDGPGQPDVSWPSPGLRVLRLDVGPAQRFEEASLLRLVPAFIAAASAVLHRHGPYAVLHAHRTLSGLIAHRLKEMSGTPYVASFGDLALDASGEPISCDTLGAIRLDIERRVVAHADTVLACCPRQAAVLQDHYAVAPDMLALVPAGVDVDAFRPRDRTAMRRVLGWRDEDFVLVQAGRLTRHKGTDNVIRALARLGPRVHARLVVAGTEAPGSENGLRAYLADVAHRCGVASQVHFATEVTSSDLPNFVSTASVVVDTPWHESLGHSPLEAMACGVPVVASDVGAAPYHLADGVTGFLVRPRDPRGLADRLEQLHGNPALAAAFGRAGIERARTNFAWEVVARHLAWAYGQACNGVLAEAPCSWREATSLLAACSPRQPGWQEAVEAHEEDLNEAAKQALPSRFSYGSAAGWIH